MIAAVICTGASVTQQDVDLLRGRCNVVAVSDSYKLAPWADVMVAHDKKWYDANPDCDFAGPRYCGNPHGVEGTQRIYPSGGNSGCMGIIAANTLFGEEPERIILLGADLFGTHFFGPHTRNLLNNTTNQGFDIMIRQYRKLSHLPVINCSPISKLDCFPKMPLRKALNLD